MLTWRSSGARNNGNCFFSRESDGAGGFPSRVWSWRRRGTKVRRGSSAKGEEITSSCARGWTPAGISSWKRCSGLGKSCPERFGALIPGCVQGTPRDGTQGDMVGISLDSEILELFSSLNPGVLGQNLNYPSAAWTGVCHEQHFDASI